MKKILGILGLVVTLSAALVVYAETSNSTNNNASAIACVGAAVNARESALNTGVSTLAQSITSAYATRATSLQQSYTATSTSQVKTAVKNIWTTFNKSIKTAYTTWKTTKNNAWSQFKTAVKACRASSSINDSANSYSEISGQ